MKIGQILIPVVALTGIGLGVAGCSKAKKGDVTLPCGCQVECTYGSYSYDPVPISTDMQNVAPGYNRYITKYNNGMSDTIHEVFRPIADGNKKVIDYSGPWHFRRIGKGNQFLQMYDSVTMNFDNIDSAMRTLAKDTLSIVKKAR